MQLHEEINHFDCERTEGEPNMADFSVRRRPHSTPVFADEVACVVHSSISKAKVGLHSICKSLFLLGLIAPQFSKISNRINGTCQATSLRVGRSNRFEPTILPNKSKNLMTSAMLMPFGHAHLYQPHRSLVFVHV